MVKETTARMRARAEAAEKAAATPPVLRNGRVGKRLFTKIRWQLQVKTEDGVWDLYGMPTDDRQALQRTQNFRARKHPEERRRVVEHREIWVVVDIEKPGRDPGPLPEDDRADVGSRQDILRTMAQREKETRN